MDWFQLPIQLVFVGQQFLPSHIFLIMFNRLQPNTFIYQNWRTLIISGGEEVVNIVRQYCLFMHVSSHLIIYLELFQEIPKVLVSCYQADNINWIGIGFVNAKLFMLVSCYTKLFQEIPSCQCFLIRYGLIQQKVKF